MKGVIQTHHANYLHNVSLQLILDTKTLLFHINRDSWTVSFETVQIITVHV